MKNLKAPSAFVAAKISSFEKNDKSLLLQIQTAIFFASGRRLSALTIKFPSTQGVPIMPKFTDHDIRTLAYKFWQERGRPSNSLPEEDWKKAEKILMSETDESEIAETPAESPDDSDSI